MMRTTTPRAISLPLVSLIAVMASASVGAAELPLMENVEQQPLAAATGRLLDALQYVGAPLPKSQEQALRAALKEPDAAKSVRAIQEILDPHCLAMVTINPESRVSAEEGPVRKELMQQGWRTFLIKVHNEAGITAALKIESPNAAPLFKRSTGSPRPEIEVSPRDVPQRFLDIVSFDRQPLKPELSGLALEYRIVQLYSRDVGRREAQLEFNVGQGTQDLGFRNAVPILFECVPAVEVVLGVKDFDGSPTTASFVFRDRYQRVYPNPARRLAPDFFFHDQIYREDGESVHLPPGTYTVEISRGPEYFVQTQSFTVREGIASQRQEFQLKRWIHPAARGWYSGDHHVHAAGCKHYENPAEGVTPADMMRHILGEDLNVGCVLSWGPCWYAQKQYFEGKTSALSRPNYLMRYDVEVSGFPSSHAGHLCLLRLTEDDYRGSSTIEEWPSWTLPVLQWGKEQGGVVGYSHSGWGLVLPDYGPRGERVPNKQGRAADTLPDFAMPPFDGIGANEYIVTVAHDACDFISSVDTPSIWELNIWYHTLNCGFRTKISGETDFPCIYGDKVGLGRVYVKKKADEPLDFDHWILGVRDGRSYCGDGRSHVFDFRVNDVAMGEPGDDGKLSQVTLDEPGKVRVAFEFAAMLAEEPNETTEQIRNSRLDEKPYWHIERCRIGKTRKVPVEVIVNGAPAVRQEVVADGSTQSLSFDLDIPHSSWIAVRVLPSVHTNPIFVEVGGKPIRASRRSAEWCLQAVDTCWKAKESRIRESERGEARAAYDHARTVYRKILTEAAAE